MLINFFYSTIPVNSVPYNSVIVCKVLSLFLILCASVCTSHNNNFRGVENSTSLDIIGKRARKA